MMEDPELQQLLSQSSQPPSSSGRRRRSSASNSPEFEFWMVRNPSFPQPNLLSADELFSDGVLLPLHLLHLHQSDDTDPPDPNSTSAKENVPELEPESSGSGFSGNEPGSVPDLSSVLAGLSAPTFTASKRWKDIFRKGENSNGSSKERDKLRKREKRSGSGGGGNSNGAELNINIWPFSRSRSAGNGGSRPRMSAVGSTRKVSSAPCSRSNSAGESKSRKWPSSPSRGGVHLGRNSPVWQVRRGGSSFNVEKGVKKASNESRRKSAGGVPYGGGGPKAKVLNLNVPMCIGYRNHLSCRSDENSTIGIGVTAAAGGGQRGGVAPDEAVRGNNHLFNLRSLFTKKVH